MTRQAEILSALLDGEAIEPDELARALEVPDAREALRDYALIRGEIVHDAGDPGPGLFEAMEPHLAASERRRTWWPATAAAVVALLVWGVWAESDRLLEALRRMEGPPTATRILRFVPGQDWHEN